MPSSVIDPSPLQGMLLSERPETLGGSGSASREQSGYSHATIGNYKGVMLCNRPMNSFANGKRMGSQHDNPNGPVPFTSGKVHNSVLSMGLKPSVTNTSNKSQLKNSVLAKHRRWLADLQKEKRELSEKEEQNRKKKERGRKRFQKREAELRALVNEINRQSKDKTERPFWSLTEEKAESQVNRQEDDRCQELLSFVENLDFEKYINDIEISVIMSNLQDRISQLEKDKRKITEKKDDASSVAATSQTTLNKKNLEKHNSLIADEEKRKRQGDERDGDEDRNDEDSIERDNLCDDNKSACMEDDLISLSKSLLSNGAESIRSVHSRKSLSMVCNRVMQETIAEGNEEASDCDDADNAHGNKPPLIITHKNARDGTTKDLVSNLPYIHRNPAV